jgi:hypothetical protein
MVIKMKSTSIVAGSIGCIALSLTMVNSAEAGNHGSRADLPCPYGPGSGNWAPPTVASNPLNINAGVSGLVPVELVGTLTGPDAAFNQDENGLTIVSAVQYDGYATAPLAASTCTSTTNSPGPLTQVMDYGIQAGSQLSLTNGSTLTLAAGTTEVAFYYDQATTSLTRFQSAPGTASFTIGGVTYSSTGSLVPYNTGNDFFFDASGDLVAAFNQFGDSLAVTGTPTGWTSSGAVSPAPEMDVSSSIAALLLLTGGLAVMRDGRRSIRLR